ncbi:MAG: hypothetical protein KDB69_03435, partial [Acidimicrobiia bacterium]|nr:hypothetical protein [Acidimicrobiia bacterium]
IDGASIATAGPYTIIEYDGERPFFDAAGGGTDPGPLLDMEIILIDQVDPAGPEIVMAYDNVTPGVPGVVGVENANGTEGVTVAAGDTSAVISDGSVLCWDWVSPEFPAQVITYQVTVDEDAPHGTLTNSVTSVTDNPGDKATTTSVDADNTNLGHIGGPARDALDTVRGEISNLIDNRDPNEHWVDVGLLKTARTLLYRADRSRYWIDDDTLGRSGAVALLYMQLAASALEGVHSHASFDGDAELLAQSVAGIARGLAADAIDESSAHPYLITQAEKYLDKGDKDYDKGHFSQAVSDYRRAWSLANTSWGWGHRHW